MLAGIELEIGEKELGKKEKAAGSE